MVQEDHNPEEEEAYQKGDKVSKKGEKLPIAPSANLKFRSDKPVTTARGNRLGARSIRDTVVAIRNQAQLLYRAYQIAYSALPPFSCCPASI